MQLKSQMQRHVTNFLHCITTAKIRSCVALAWWLVYIYAVTVYASYEAHEVSSYNNKYYIYMKIVNNILFF